MNKKTLLCFIYFLLISFLSLSITSYANGTTITLDPGHSPSRCGVTTSGAPGEMALNWEITKKLEPKLKALGYNVVLTKNSLNECVSNKQRAEIANNNNSALLFRIHLNSGSSSKYFMITPATTSRYTNLPTAASIAKGNQAARSIISALNAAKLKLTSSSNPYWPDSRAGSAGDDKKCPGLLAGSCYSKVPVTLIEMGGASNGWLNNATNQEAMATALAQGIKNFAPVTAGDTTPTTASSSASSSSSPTSEKSCAVVKVGSPPGPIPTCSTSTETSADLTAGEKAVALARSQIGKKYIWAQCHGNLASYPPPKGCPSYDCSGLTRWAWYWATNGKVTGLICTNYNWDQGRGGFKKFYKEQVALIKVGDLVYYGSNPRDAYHTGIYSGNGKVIHARGSRYGVVETSLYYKSGFIGFLRPNGY